jgi:dihydrofolate synthase / folylpolyglutamate synthase
MNQIETYFSNYNYSRIVYNLDNINELIRLSKIDFSKIKFIHITGSKGKGSTAFYINEFLIAAGIKTGLYTSPHIIKVNERIKVNNKEISDTVINEIFFFYEKIIRKIKPTYFELLTFLALVYFVRKKVEWAVLEVGLGGRYDATNIVNSSFSVITSIELEHQQYLGNTKLKILKEKAEIIKKNSVSVVNIKEKHLFEYLKKICLERNTTLINVAYDNYNIFEVKNNALFQVENIKIALKIVEILNKQNSEFKLQKNQIQYIIKTKSPFGRFSLIKKITDIPVIVDVAHTVKSINTLIETIKINQFQKPVFIFNCLADKDYKKIINQLENIADTIIILKLNNTTRVTDFELLKKIIKLSSVQYIYTDNLNSISFNKINCDVIIATGSFYLVETVVKYFKTFSK